MLRSAFNFMCWVFGVSAGGDPTESKWTKIEAQRQAEQGDADLSTPQVIPSPPRATQTQPKDHPARA